MTLMKVRPLGSHLNAFSLGPFLSVLLFPSAAPHGAERMDQFRMCFHRNGEAGKVLPPDRGWSETTE
jgi:hypothetical protein